MRIGLSEYQSPVFNLKKRLQELGLDDLVAVEIELADTKARTLVDRDVQLHPARFLVDAVLDGLDLGLADARADVAPVTVVLDDLFGVFVELVLVVGALAGDPRQHAVRLRGFHLAAERADRSTCGIAVEVDGADLDLRPFLDVEHDLHELGAGRQRLDARRDLGELVALVRHERLDDALHAPDDGLVEERVEAQRDAELLHLLVDLGALDLRRSRVVDDLDARALFHVVDDSLARHAVGKRRIDRFNPEVVEEAGGPQPLEVLEQRLLGLVVERHEHAFGRAAQRGLDVIEIGLRFDDRFVDRMEAELGLTDGRCRPRRRHLFEHARSGRCRRRLHAAGAPALRRRRRSLSSTGAAGAGA